MSRNAADCLCVHLEFASVLQKDPTCKRGAPDVASASHGLPHLIYIPLTEPHVLPHIGLVMCERTYAGDAKAPAPTPPALPHEGTLTNKNKKSM